MDAKEFAARVGEIVRGYVDRRLEPMQRELDAARKELEELRSSACRYRGTWSRVTQYKRGDEVTHVDGRWFCTRDDPGDRPGMSDSWQLTAKTYRPGTRDESP